MIQSLLEGILMGGVYALAALGVSLIFGVMKITNFAHGALTMIGMYVTYEICNRLGVVPYVALPLTTVVMFFIGYIIQQGLINPIITAPSHNQLLLTLGISIILENMALAIWTPNYKSITVPGFDKALNVAGISINKPKVVAFIFVVVVTSIIYVILTRTDLGRAIRATSMESEGASLVGIRIKNINSIAFAIGVACAGIAGTLLTPILYISPSIGNTLLLKCFVISVLGGLGNIWGALLAGLIIGVVESTSGFMLGGTWSEMVIYAIFILTLFMKPTGLFGRRVSRG